MTTSTRHRRLAHRLPVMLDGSRSQGVALACDSRDRADLLGGKGGHEATTFRASRSIRFADSHTLLSGLATSW
jgi:hypothetical protein